MQLVPSSYHDDLAELFKLSRNLSDAQLEAAPSDENTSRRKQVDSIGGKRVIPDWKRFMRARNYNLER